MKIKSKKEIEENKLKRQKVFKILKRILDILMYSWALILTIGLIVGSCSKKNDGSTNLQLNRKNRIADEVLVVENDFYFSFNQDKINQPFGVTNRPYFGFDYNSLPSSQGSYNFEMYINATMNIEGNDISVNRIDFEFEYEPQSNYFEMTYVNFWNTKVWNKYVVYDGSDFTNYLVYCSIDTYRIDTDDNNYGIRLYEFTKTGLLQYFGYVYPIADSYYQFNLNQQINYNSPVNADYNQAFIVSGDSSKQVNIDLPNFLSGGQIFNRLHFVYDDAIGRIKVNDEVINNNTGGYAFSYLQYVNTLTGVTVTVNRRIYHDYVVNGSYATYRDYGSYWVNDRYKVLNFFEEPNNNSINSLTSLNNTTSTYNGGYTNGSYGLDSVFTLLGNSLSALMGLFNISIIPGMTLGLLLFLPLIVTIIVLVFKAVKK